jgi:asparagine synthase (glutamine-hydrolysing)
MCGILAIIEGQGTAAPRDEALFGAALDLMEHRGPDDRGVWRDALAWLGHRRLAIIDLSPGGHQPMTDAETGVTITFNGEIYNYLELREELRSLGHTFKSESDTEVLLRAFLAWGSECLRRFNGMWHFVIWDPRDRTAFIARDRLGIKPSYYSLEGGRLIVASEPKAILAIEPTRRRVDRSALRDFLIRSALYSSNRSFYEGIFLLPPAHQATFHALSGRFVIERYWAPPSPEASCSTNLDLEQFATLFADSVRLRMRSDVPVGLTLSGGLDSTTILSEAAKYTDHLVAFTSVYRAASEPNVTEEKWARLAVSPFANVKLQAVDAKLENWIETLRQISWHMDGPADSPAVYPLWRIMEQARTADVPVLLEGQGADELLGGYIQHAALDTLDALSQAMRRLSPIQWSVFARMLLSYSRTFTATRLGLSMMRAQFPSLLPLYRFRFGPLGALRRDFIAEDRHSPATFESGSGVQTRLLNDLVRDTLPGLLQYGDAVSMAHSIESRFPFLDYRLVEMCVSLPMALKIANGQTKRALRALLHQAGLHQIAERRDKKGYPTPVNTWLAAKNGQLAREVLLAPRARIHEFCEPRGLARLIEMHLRGINRMTGYHLYRLVSTEIWLQRCIGTHINKAGPTVVSPTLYPGDGLTNPCPTLPAVSRPQSTD